MVVYSNARVRVAELHYDEPAATPAVDVIRRLSYTQPVPGTLANSFQSLHIDLKQGPEAILAGMNSKTRQKIRKAAGEGIRYEFREQPDREWVRQFVSFYDAFAERKRLPRANRPKLDGMGRSGVLDLSRVTDAEGRVLSWHCHTRTPNRVLSLYAGSLRMDGDKALAALVSRANCWHYFQDMSRFAKGGCGVYDFGPWYTGSEDDEKLNINYFKHGFGGQLVQLYSSDAAVTLKGLLAVYVRQALSLLRGRR